MKAFRLLFTFGVIAICTVIVLAGTVYFLSIPKTDLRSVSTHEATAVPTSSPMPTQSYPTNSPRPTQNSPTLSAAIPTTLTLSIPSTTEAGKAVTISSILTDFNQYPVSGASVYYTEPVSGGIMFIGSGWTDSGGKASCYFTFNQVGTYQIQATYSGRSIYFPNAAYSGSSDVKTITITEAIGGKSATTLSFTVSPSDKVTTQTRLTLSATLADGSGQPLANVAIIFQWSTDNATWHHIGVAALDVAGHAELLYTPSQTGNLMFQAVFNGDANHYPMQSSRTILVS